MRSISVPLDGGLRRRFQHARRVLRSVELRPNLVDIGGRTRFEGDVEFRISGRNVGKEALMRHIEDVGAAFADQARNVGENPPAGP